ncbi:MAG: cardiolipin synthase [Eubacteriales bacterium]|nr:cardiolipin synthase [Eubacteriales bacterium]
MSEQKSVSSDRQTAGPQPKPKFNYKLKLRGASRIFLAGSIFVLEVVLIIMLSLRINTLSVSLYLALQVVGLVVAIYLFQHHGEDSYTIFWMLLTLFFPALGLILYLLWGRKRRLKKQKKSFADSQARLEPYKKDPQASLQELANYDISDAAHIQIKYLTNLGFPIYTNSPQQYFDSGEGQFEQMFRDMENAKDYIFVQYFILSDGYILARTFDIMARKSQEGLDVRLLYDDFGSSARVSKNILDDLESQGVKLVAFNRVSPYLSGYHTNYRNHQKVCIIDGKVGWLGGTNLADEYANLIVRFGHWKDTAIRLEGEVCHNLLINFLIMWQQSEKHPLDQDIDKFLPRIPSRDNQQGITIPFWDGPLGMEENPAANLVRSLFTTARHNIVIMTPYFVLEHNMVEALCMAADCGVKVTLMTPGIPDKPQVYVVTRSNYGPLLKHGCEVYEYEPGFLHAKTIMVDDKRVILGSINLDYRSLYLNFENAVFICDSPVIKDIRRDIDATLAVSRQVTHEDWKRRPVIDKIKEPLWKTFSPLL